ncbi:NPXTG-anchored protein [Ruminococcus sp. NK3A76]|uniref:NPXTG-anchored protein n=1 Tax=Ruminococcus sp. NK3A76 TaxID=877411 RepID=UPI000569D314|nr:NPXTG-anchored protein [Ruminococcus sp. NK3A76]
MKLRKIFAGMSALAIAATMSISAAAETGDTFLMVADNGWAYSNMNKDPDFALPEGGTTAKVTEDGTYTVDVTLDGMVAWMNKVAKAENPDAKEVVVDQKGYGFEVLCVDIEGLAEKLGCSTGEDAWDDYCTDTLGIKPKKATSADKMAYAKSTGLNITDLTLTCDGTEVYKFADGEFYFGDIEGNGKIRIELFNKYGSSLTDAPDAVKDWAANNPVEYEKAEVTFTITGVNGSADDGAADDGSADDGTTDDGAADDGATDDGATDDGTTDDGATDDGSTATAGGSDSGTTTTGGDTAAAGSTAGTTTGTGTAAATGNTSTGASAGLALAGLALAGAAVVISKKR